MPAIWRAETTKQSERKEIVRQLIEKIYVAVVGDTERVEVTIHWAGGYESRHEIRRAVSSYRRLADGADILRRVSELKQMGLPHTEVARRLNSEGFHAPRGDRFTTPMVAFLCKRARQAKLLAPASTCGGGTRPATTETEAALSDCWRARHLAKRLEIPATTLNTWRRRGWVHACRWGGLWLYWANSDELERLSNLRNHPRTALAVVPSALTSPSDRPLWPTNIHRSAAPD